MIAAITGSDALVACAIGSFALGVALAVNSWLKDRSTEHDKERRSNREDIEVLRREVDHLTITLVGRQSADGFPGVKGFVQEQTATNDSVAAKLRKLMGGDG